MSSPSDGAGPGDPAALHARRLLRALACEQPVDDRPAAPSPALEWARSGAMTLTGEAEGPPRFAAGALATAARGAELALAALVPGTGSALAALDGPALLGERAALFGLERRGRISCGGSARLLPLADGEIALNLPRTDDWRLLPAWLECDLPGVADGRDWAALEPVLRGRRTAALVERGREIGLAVAPVVPPPAWRGRPSDAAPHACFRLSGATQCSPGMARLAARSSRPRVLDLSTLWAGPLAGSLLVAAGCDVLKVESPQRPDGARAGNATFFALLNEGKCSCALDLAAARDREVFARLLEVADIVIESARPRALAQLGFDARTWVDARPGRIWTSITGYGREHEWIAFGDDAAVSAGLAYDPPRDGAASLGPPRFCADAIADPLTGLHAAVAILALRREGRGGLLALSLAEVAAHAMGEPAPGALTLPLTRRDGGWAVWRGSAWESVAPARARRPAAPAPPLAPPDAAVVERWLRGC